MYLDLQIKINEGNDYDFNFIQELPINGANFMHIYYNL